MTKHCKPGSYASFTRAFRGVSTTTRTLSPSVHNGNLLRSAMLERSPAPAFADEELAWNNGGGLWRFHTDYRQSHPLDLGGRQALKRGRFRNGTPPRWARRAPTAPPGHTALTP